MVVTVLQAQVASEQTQILEQEYRQAIKQLDGGIVETFLLHNLADPKIWQIVTVWESRQALEAMRQSGETPRGILIFRAAGAEPTLTMMNVAAHGSMK